MAVVQFFIIILAVMDFRRPPYNLASLSKPSRWLFYIALVLIGLYCGFNLIFAVGEMAGGDMSGASHRFSEDNPFYFRVYY